MNTLPLPSSEVTRNMVPRGESTSWLPPPTLKPSGMERLPQPATPLDHGYTESDGATARSRPRSVEAERSTWAFMPSSAPTGKIFPPTSMRSEIP
jgi:hypothetical protein